MSDKAEVEAVLGKIRRIQEYVVFSKRRKKDIQSLDKDISFVCTGDWVSVWEKFYKDFFGIDFKAIGISIPENQSSFGWLLAIAQSMTSYRVFYILINYFQRDEKEASIICTKHPVSKNTSCFGERRVEGSKVLLKIIFSEPVFLNMSNIFSDKNFVVSRFFANNLDRYFCAICTTMF